MAIDLQQTSSQNIQQLQRLIMSPAMQQAVYLMQLPAMELSAFIETSLEQNPLIERVEGNVDQSEEDPPNEGLAPEQELTFSEDDFSVLQQLEEDFQDYWEEESKTFASRTSAEERLQTFLEQSIPENQTLFEHLMDQAKSCFETEQERAMAEALIGNLDDFGYLRTSLAEIAALHHFSEEALENILRVVQTFEPNGIAARSLQECLSIQLVNQGKQNTLAAAIISRHFEHLLHNQIPAIQKDLHCSPEEIQEVLEKHISRLDMRPGAGFQLRASQHIVPDVTLHQEENGFRIEVNNDFIPPIRISGNYRRMAQDQSLSTDAKQFIHQHVSSAKWLLRNIQQRNETIERIAKKLSEKQSEFFSSPTGELKPLTMSVLAEELGLHESTIARAVANKYLQCPRGILPLRSFFTNAYTTQEGGSISSNVVREALRELILKEDKAHPLSDAALADLLQKRGIPCARRTVAKYRVELHFGTAQQRRKF